MIVRFLKYFENTKKMKKSGSRLAFLDALRGLALMLMILTHSLRILTQPELLGKQMPESFWGICLLLSKMAMPVFVVVSGFTMNYVYTYVKSLDFRNSLIRLWRRALIIFFTYLICVFLEGVALIKFNIIQSLFHFGFSWSEILVFYAAVFLTGPVWLLLRKYLGWSKFVLLAFLFLILSFYLHPFLDGQDVSLWQAFLFGGPKIYFFPLLFYLPLFLFGMAIADFYVKEYCNLRYCFYLILILIVSLALGIFFNDRSYVLLYYLTHDFLRFPPVLAYRAFSLSIALIVFFSFLIFYKQEATVKYLFWLPSIHLLGRYPLQFFVFKSFLLFIIFEYLLHWRHALHPTWAFVIAIVGIVLFYLGLLVRQRFVERNH